MRIHPPRWQLTGYMRTVKQEIFYSDVTTCFNALKKAVQDLSTMSANAAQLQMGQPAMRYARVHS